MAADPPDALELLERSERVRALARAILGRADGADDVAQEALIASLGWGHAGEETLPERLAAQVRSLASRWRRSGARRARREAAAARVDRSPSASELTERAELQRTLVEAVLALDEPYRECVILRYFEGLPPRAIAELRALPVRTVQTRLARALTQLRARLERRVDLSAWAPLLAPLGVQPTTSLPLPSSVAGALALATSKWAVSLSVAALIGAAVFVLRPGGLLDAPEPGPVAGQQQPSAADVPGVDVVTSEVGSPEVAETRAAVGPLRATSEPTEAPPDRELDLFGEVVGVYGHPLAGVELNALEPQLESSLSACERPEGGVVLASTLSDGEGRFRIRLERGQECTLEAHLPGLAGARLLERRAGERVRVVLGPPATLWGRVTRASDGSGVGGAQIRLRMRPDHVTTRMVCREIDSDADGSYEFSGLPAGNYDAWVTCADDPGVSSPAIALSAGQSREQDFVVPSGIDVAGRVLDAATGEAIADAEVSLHPFFESSSRSAQDGRFVLRGWDAQSHGVSVHARAAGYAYKGHELHKGQIPEGEIEIALAADAGVTGRILDPRGVPRPDALVEVHGSDFAPQVRRDRASIRSGPDGRFELRGLSRDQAHTLVASSPGAGRLIVDLPDFDPARDPRDLGDLGLPVASSLAGRVIDAAGQPLPGAYVTLVGGDPGRRRLRGLELEEELRSPVTPTLVLRLDDVGRFRANDLSPGEYVLGVQLTGSSSAQQTAVSLREGEQREGLELVLDLGLRIAGTVVGPEGEPIALATIDAVPARSDAGVETAMNTRADGSFDLTGLADGEYTLNVTHFENLGGRRYCGARIEGIAAGTLDLRIVLPSAAPITGVVLSADGVPLQDATVQIDHGDGRVGGLAATRTDALGRFRLLVPVGVPVDLLAADWSRVAEGVDAVKLGRVQAVEPGTTDLTIRIDP
jgi:RNA polymerase sigma factor (sigma-70 family)